MKNTHILLAALLALSMMSVQAQTNSRVSQKSVYFSAGPSFTGSGDLSGLNLITGFSYNFKSWNTVAEVATTLYHGEYPLYYYLNRGGSTQLIDGSIRYNTYGVQLNIVESYRVIKKSNHDLNFGIGPVLRYQSSSDDGLNIDYPAVTGLDYPVITYNHRESQNIISIGAIAKIVYNYHISNKLYIGAAASFQVDTNGDTISNTGFSVGCNL